MQRRGLAFILSGFPRRSETFALNEVRALEARGLLPAIFATKPGDGLPLHPGYETLAQRVYRLPEGSPAEQAEHIIAQLRGHNIAGIHAYFAHTPAEIAMQVACRLGIPYGFSVHAKDARKITPTELARRARGAACVVACNTDVADELHTAGAPVTLLPHGVDTLRFNPQPSPPSPPLRLLAVGRLVPKKGFDLLLRTAVRLSFPFQLRIVGEGPERRHLEALVEAGKLGNRVALCGSLSHAELPAEYANAHIVVVPSVVDAGGDRDGLPNVVLEALACGRPVVASDVGAISNAVTSGDTGVLVPERDVGALAQALETLACDPGLRERLGQNARARVLRDYALERCTKRFCDFLEAAYTKALPVVAA